MSKYTLKTKKRDEAGKNRVDKLRNEGLIPGVVYQRGEEPESVKVVELEFNKVFAEAGTSTLVDLDLDGESKTVLIKEVQKHPVRNQILHIDFQGVKMDEKLKVFVPVVLLERDSIRVQPSVLIQMLDEIEVECLPGDIPQAAEIDVKDMQIGDVYTVADLDIANNPAIDILIDQEEPVASLSEPQEEVVEEEEEEEVDAADVPEVGEEEEEEE